ncbi:MAG: VOC family virulence protein [Gammaproteobacteria bacterium]|nr:VOC family virulence protein [Gammaproteobacteria bacterium]
MIKVIAIDHIVLRTSKIAEMKEFYSNILNCPPERELLDLGLLQLRAGSALIDLVPVDSELGRLGGKAPNQDGRNMDHLCLQIDNVEDSELLDYLERSGIKVEEFAERYGAEGLGRSLYINDPEGNIVELKYSKK